MTKSRHINAPKYQWTDAQLQALREQYPDRRAADIAEGLELALHQVYCMANRLGLKKSDAFKASPLSGRTDGKLGAQTRFQKGGETWNKGLQIQQTEAAKATQFKPGQNPYNTKQVGDLRVTKDGTLQRKIGNAKGSNSMRWRSIHELVWIAENGPVPKKYIVIFKPGMKTIKLDEITIDRIECVSFEEQMRRNSLHNYGPEIAKLTQLRGAITRQINMKGNCK